MIIMGKRDEFRELGTKQHARREGFFQERVALGRDIALQMLWYYPERADLFGNGVVTNEKQINHHMGRVYRSMQYSLYQPLPVDRDNIVDNANGKAKYGSSKAIRLYVLDESREEEIRLLGAAYFYNYLSTAATLIEYRRQLFAYHYFNASNKE